MSSPQNTADLSALFLAGMPRFPHRAFYAAQPVFRQVHFIGIGGVGMSGLATILLENGVCVSGSDAAASPVLDRLERLGARVTVGHAAANLGAATLAVFSTAVPAQNPERVEAERRGIPLCRRGAFLAGIASLYANVVAVGGSHGKSTTSAMIAHVLRETGLRPGFLVGGDVQGWAAPAAAGDGRILVTEVDESDTTQALLHSTHAVVTNVDDDHCWSVGGVAKLEQCFVDFADSAALLFSWEHPTTRRLFAPHRGVRFIGPADIPANLTLGVPGEHNRRNAAVAVAVTTELGVAPAEAAAALGTFTGVSRRLSERYRAPSGAFVVVEDYAHHPAELRASLQALREKHPGFRLTVVFQPHRFERVKRYAADFGRELDTADDVFVVPPFAAWIADAGLAEPRDIVRGMTNPRAVFWDEPLEALAARLGAECAAGREKRLLAVIGAGDVGRLATLLRDELVRNCSARLEAGLRQACPGLDISRGKSWAELTTLGVGTARPLVACPGTLAELSRALAVAREHAVPVLVLGAGSNLVGTDAEPPRLVLHLDRGEFAKAVCESNTWYVGAGATFATVWERLKQRGVASAAFAPLAWIPGTLGGGVRMNAGAHGATIGELVTALRGMRTSGEPWTASGAALAWGYRVADIPPDVIVTEVQLRVRPGPQDAAERAYRESGQKRRAALPAGRSAGSVFRNAGSAAAGRLIEQSGCTGWRQGGCRVSDKHANVIVAEAPASEKDFLSLLLRVRQQVFDKTGVVLMPEVKLAGDAAERQVRESLPAVRVVVLKGGPSSECAVSLRSGAAVAAALREGGFSVDEVVVTGHELPRLPRKFDVVFPVLHGEFGEDGQIQALLAARGLRYVGSSPEASRAIMDKLESKKTLLRHGIPTPRFAVLPDAAAPPPAELQFPLVVKPNNQGSTIGISKVTSTKGGWWRRALTTAFAMDSCVFAEEFIAGQEITVGLLHGRVLPVVEIQPPKGRMFDNDAKYDHKHGHTRYLCPPETVSAAAQKRAQEFAAEFFAVLGAKDLLRVDFIVDAGGTPWCLEGNAIPGFTATSLLPKAAAAAGISFVELCASLVKANL